MRPELPESTSPGVLAQSMNAIYRGFGNGGDPPLVPSSEVQVPYRAVPQK
jgi:hypothetical protein